MGADTLPRDLTEVFAVPTDTGIALLAWSDADGRHRIDKISRDLRSAAPLFETTTPFYVLGSAPGALALCLQDRPGVIFVDLATGVGRDSLSTSHEPTLRPRWMAFHDMLHGAALFPGLGLHVTRDGGASFQPVVPLRGFSDENLAAYDWQSDGLLLRAPERGNRGSDAGPSFCRISEETASCEEATNPLRPLERWLETDLISDNYFCPPTTITFAPDASCGRFVRPWS